MVKYNYFDAISKARKNYDLVKVKMILDQLNFDTNTGVPDRYYGEADGFEIVYRFLSKNVR